MEYFADKTILVTGATSGIGKSLCFELEKHGTRIVLVARDEDKMNAMKALLQFPDRHLYICYDLTDLEHYHYISDKYLKVF